MTDDLPPLSSEEQTPPPVPATPLLYTNRALPTVLHVSTGWQIIIAFLAGCVISAIAYPLLWGKNGNAAVVAAIILLGVKFIAGVTLLCFRGKRGYGGGLLASLAVGFIIFFFTCAAGIGG